LELDKPVPVRYVKWLGRILRLDFSDSLLDGRPVIDVILEKLPVTIYLNLVSIIVVMLVSITVGVYSALHRGDLFDRFFEVFFFVLYSLFVPWISLTLISVFGVNLNLLPIYGITSDYFEDYSLLMKFGDVVSHSLLPVLVLSYTQFAFYSRIVRGSTLEVLNQEYITTARAKGLSERVVLFKHALKNAMVPLVTLFGAMLPSMISGSVIVEKIFSIDGMGLLFFSSVMSRDFPMIMGLSTLSAVLTLIGLLLSDVLYAWVDPRIRLE